MYVMKTYVNKDQNARFGGDEDPEEYPEETLGDLFRHPQEEFGKCVSSLYREKKDGAVKRHGWVFEKRMPYSDFPKETYLQETWVEIVKSFIPPQIIPGEITLLEI